MSESDIQVISLIGPPGTGKSHLGENLAEMLNCQFDDVDAMIRARLRSQLAIAGCDTVDAYLGEPGMDSYVERRNEYLVAEGQSVDTILGTLDFPTRRPIVIAHTGSCVYLGSERLEAIRDLTTVVYLRSDETQLAALYELYQREPRPVVWPPDLLGEYFSDIVDENDRRERMARYYPELIRTRLPLYENLAHVTLEQDEFRGENIDLSWILEAIRTRAAA